MEEALPREQPPPWQDLVWWRILDATNPCFPAQPHLCPGKQRPYFFSASVFVRNAASTSDEIEIRRPDDQRDRFLLAEELPRLKKALDGEVFGPHGGDGPPSARVISWDHYRMRLIVLAALTTGMRLGEIFVLCWSDLDYGQG